MNTDKKRMNADKTRELVLNAATGGTMGTNAIFGLSVFIRFLSVFIRVPKV
jgi:hypothetical protein